MVFFCNNYKTKNVISISSIVKTFHLEFLRFLKIFLTELKTHINIFLKRLKTI